MSYKTSQVELNVPNKVLGINVSTVAGHTQWAHQNGSGDRWATGGASPKFYKWTITFTVTSQAHGSHLTRKDREFNGLDVTVGDWIAGATTGQCLKITSVTAKSSTSVTCVVEDVARYNTFKSNTGNGIFNTGSCVIFTLNESGHPMLDPLPSGIVSSDFYANVNSRFQYLNPQLNYLLEKTAHGFAIGDVIAVSDTGTFVKANAALVSKSFGVVVENGPGPDAFMVSPNNRIIDFVPAIPGAAGDFIYADTDGDLTTSDTGKIMFLKIANSVETNTIGSAINPTVPDGTTVIFNSVSHTFNGAGFTSTLAETVSQINGLSGTSIVASSSPAPTTVNSVASGTAYGLVGGYTPFSAIFNGGGGNTTVSFTTNAAGQAAYGIAVGIPEDMATDINAASIPNLTATFTSTVLTLTEANGNSISIFSNTNDANGNPYVGSSNVSGLPTFTTASTGNKLKLVRTDGGPIDIFDSTGNFENNIGMFSVHNGMYPLAMNVEQGIRAASSTVVADISARNSLSPTTGDQAYVIDNGVGEWALYLWDGSAWVKVSDQDSANTDAQTLTLNVTAPISGFGNSKDHDLGNVSPGGKIQSVSIDIHTPFTGGSQDTTMEVGTTADHDLLHGVDDNDPGSVGGYLSNPEYIWPSSNSAEFETNFRINHYSATAGNVTVKVTYI
tara:strand:+ start:2318 stop:4330 length:2013 start_codon:yes stop_codon:yes gene_type:complete